MTTENTMISFLDKQEKRLQELEDHIAGKDKKPEPEQETSEEDKFIELMKTVNSTASMNKIDAEDDGDEFINAMKDTNC